MVWTSSKPRGFYSELGSSASASASAITITITTIRSTAFQLTLFALEPVLVLLLSFFNLSLLHFRLLLRLHVLLIVDVVLVRLVYLQFNTALRALLSV